MDTRESAPAVRNHRPTGDDTMQMATTLRRSTHTFLTHLFGPGLNDDRYVIERFQSKADGEIRPRRRNGSSKKGRGKASREIVSLSTVQRMRPERDEIIICTGVNCTTLGVQFWGEYAIWRHMCQWRSKKGPPRRCKKGPLGGCGLVPVVHGRAPRATRRALNRLTRRRAREGPVGPRGQAWAGWSVQLAVGV